MAVRFVEILRRADFITVFRANSCRPQIKQAGIAVERTEIITLSQAFVKTRQLQVNVQLIHILIQILSETD